MSAGGGNGMDGLRSERLRFDRPELADVADIFRIHGDPRTYEHAPDGVMRDPMQAGALFAAWQGHWDEHGFGYATVRGCVGEVREGAVLGFAGVKWQSVLGHRVLNLYYRFAPEAWGHGYASEAASALVGWGDHQHPDTPVLARVAVANPASRRVAERAGLRAVPDEDPGDAIPHVLLLSRPW